MTPGVSTALVLRNSMAGGVRAGLTTAVGINAGSIVYGLLTAFGFALALRRWPWVWTLVRAGGVTYLAWLGFASLRRAFGAGGVHAGSGTLSREPGHYLREGFVTNLLNPSIASFYLAVLP